VHLSRESVRLTATIARLYTIAVCSTDLGLPIMTSLRVYIKGQWSHNLSQVIHNHTVDQEDALLVGNPAD
jgi:hypothetical protein